jgi:hypothetical protein
MPLELLWPPLLAAAGKTLVGIIGSYASGRVLARYFQQNTFDGAMDLWHRGIHGNHLTEGERIRLDSLVSPYAQLFPGDPMENGRRWNQLYDFSGRITSAEYQSMEFFAGSDAALRIGSLNGETVVGLYARYGFIGEGLVGVVPTSLVRKALPDFFQPDFIGVRAMVAGRLARCPSQHAYAAQAIAQRVGIRLPLEGYRSTWYLQIDSIRPFRGASSSTTTLLGSIWAATDVPSEQYLVQYGYLTTKAEHDACVSSLTKERAWRRARVYCDDIDPPDRDLSFKTQFM